MVEHVETTSRNVVSINSTTAPGAYYVVSTGSTAAPGSVVSINSTTAPGACYVVSINSTAAPGARYVVSTGTFDKLSNHSTTAPGLT